MASDITIDEKPNLRPIKRNSACGKTIFLHHNPNQLSNKLYLNAISPNLNGQGQVSINYSLDKHQRWKLLNDFHQNNLNERNTLSNNDIGVQDTIAQKHVSTNHRKNVSVLRYRQIKAKLQRSIDSNDDDDENSDDGTSYSILLPPRKTQLDNIRRNYETKDRKVRSNVQRVKFIENQEQFNATIEFDNDEDSVTSDEDESIISDSTYAKPRELHLNDFLSNSSDSANVQNTTCQNNLSQSSSDDCKRLNTKRKFFREISFEQERVFDQSVTLSTHKSEILLRQKFTPLIFQTLSMYKSELNNENLSTVYGKNFIHTQCYPTKYLISLTDRLKCRLQSNKSDNISLNCCLILILNDDNEDICQVKFAVNIESTTNDIKLNNLSESVYKIDELIIKILECIESLPIDELKKNYLEINRKLYENSQSNEYEFYNKKIDQIKSAEYGSIENTIRCKENSIESNVCTSCYSTIDESSEMTILKPCSHWLCNDCWRQYLENSITQIKIIFCPQSNCYSTVDIGTMLSLVNIDCVKIYEDNVEKCLVNKTHSHIRCPSKSCMAIIELIDPNMDHVRCRCGLRFCIDCKNEPHFPVACNSYQMYLEELHRNGDLICNNNGRLFVTGRTCISCNQFIEKNGGCNHMTCRCGAEFCWLCTGFWKNHYAIDGTFSCPRPQILLQKRVIVQERNHQRSFYTSALFHRIERTYQNQLKYNGYVKRLMGTIPLEKENILDSSFIKSQIDKRENILKYAYGIVKHINYLHRICECTAVAIDGYANKPVPFTNMFSQLEAITSNLCQTLEYGRGYGAIEELNQLHKQSEKVIRRMRCIVIQQNLNQTGHRTN